MDKQTMYMALLTLYENNFRGLHWKLSGHGFEKNHTRFGDYYEKLGELMDETAELMITQGMPPVSVIHVGELLEQSDYHAIAIDMSKDYDEQTANAAALSMFTLLHQVSLELEDEDDLDADVRDFYMDHSRYFRIEGLYKLKRALGVQGTPESVPEEEEEDDEED